MTLPDRPERRRAAGGEAGPERGHAVRPRDRRHPGRPPPRERHLPRRHHRVAPPRRVRRPATASTTVRDVGSLNGTYVNRERIEEAVLVDGRRGADREVQARLPGGGWTSERACGAVGERPVSSRTYLSIGDVLTLLRQEFPDVTISKIRFLESQGLVNPERTPSGYRKFYEHDVERLRWVLRQQREHFLPLKVIKGRLEQEEPTTATTTRRSRGPRRSDNLDDLDTEPVAASGDASGADGHTADAVETASPRLGRRRAEPVLGGPTPAPRPAGDHAAARRPTGGAPPRDCETPARHGAGGTGAGAVGDGGRHAGRRPGDARAWPGDRRPALPVGVGPPVAPAASRPGQAAGAPPRRRRRRRRRGRARRVRAGGRRPATSSPSTTVGRQHDHRGAGRGQRPRRGDRRAARVATACCAGAWSAGSRTTTRTPSPWPGWRRDSARYGVEARHLRLHKHAAEREAGLHRADRPAAAEAAQPRGPPTRPRHRGRADPPGPGTAGGAPAHHLARPARRVTERAPAHGSCTTATSWPRTVARLGTELSATPTPTACSWWRS